MYKMDFSSKLLDVGHDGCCLFVCIEVLRPRQPNGVMSSAVSLPNHTVTGQIWSSKRLTSTMHILSSKKTDNFYFNTHWPVLCKCTEKKL